MPIPSNLLPINNPFRAEVEEAPATVIPTTSIITGIPNNLLPINASDISASFQSFAGVIPSGSIPQIPQFSILNTVIPDRLFTTGNLDQVKARTLNAATTYLNTIPALPTIPTLPTLIIPRPRIPSYGQIKNYIETKIDRIKQQRQKASIKALNQELKKQENPFQHRQSLKNEETRNTVLGRFNNQ